MTAKYTKEFLHWYNNLSNDEYRSHYYAWLERDVCIQQQKVIQELLGGKHFSLVYDLSYGGGELSRIISHDTWIKSAVDNRQKSLVNEITPTAEIKCIEHPLDFPDFTHASPDLIIAVNVVRNLDINPSYLRKLWHSVYCNRNTIFDIILADDEWIGLNDRAFNTSFLKLVDGWQIVPQLYWEFPQGVRWYMCHYSADTINWLPTGKLALAEQNKDITEAAIFSVVGHAYTDISFRHVLDLSQLLLNITANDVITTDDVDDVINLPTIREHYDIVLGLGLLSRIEQHELFARYIIGHIDADVYIFSGIESDSYMPKKLLYNGDVGGVEHTYRHYSRLKMRIKKEFNYNSYILRGSSPKEFMNSTSRKRAFRGREVYVVVEASYQTAETIARTAGF